MEAQPCADTPLARLLHTRGRLPLETIQAVLAETRQARPGGPGLAERLIERGLLDAGEAAEWAAQFGAPLWGPGAVLQRLADLSEEVPEAVPPQRAVEAMRQALILREHDPWARYRLAHFQLRAGQAEEARVALVELSRVRGVQVFPPGPVRQP